MTRAKRSALRTGPSLITGDCMLTDSLETLPSPHGLLPVRRAAEDAKQPMTVNTQLCRRRLVIAPADLSATASVPLHGLPLLPPHPPAGCGLIQWGYLPESHPGVVGGRWEIKAKEERKCKTKQSNEETRRQVSRKEREIREQERLICRGGWGGDRKRVGGVGRGGAEVSQRETESDRERKRARE